MRVWQVWNERASYLYQRIAEKKTKFECRFPSADPIDSITYFVFRCVCQFNNRQHHRIQHLNWDQIKFKVKTMINIYTLALNAMYRFNRPTIVKSMPFNYHSDLCFFCSSVSVSETKEKTCFRFNAREVVNFFFWVNAISNYHVKSIYLRFSFNTCFSRARRLQTVVESPKRHSVHIHIPAR